MVITRRNKTIGFQAIVDAIKSGEAVVFALRLDYASILRLEENLSKLTGTSISLTQRRGRYVVHSTPYEGYEADGENDDLEGPWLQLPIQEVDLAVAHV